MTTGYRPAWLPSTLAVAALFLAACSDSSSGSDDAELKAALQDLGLDPDGLTTVLTFRGEKPGSLAVGQIRADGGQTAQTVVVAGKTATVTWDERVTPAHRVRVVKDGVEDDWRRVKTSDGSAPTFTVTDATQDTSDALLGGDTIEITFAGPRVVEADAEDPASWELVVAGNALDLTGSTFALDPATQVLDVTLGPGANLHAAFTMAATGLTSVADVPLDSDPVAGAATGDVAAPSLVSVEQSLAEDALGQVVDLTFDEPMDPILAATPVNFTVSEHAGSQGLTFVTGVAQPDGVTLRLSFNRPVAPGYDQIVHAGLMDAHGNALTGGTVAIANSAPAANGFSSVTATTVENSGGDTIVIVTDQTFDPDFATDPSLWSITVDAAPLVMANQTLTYDLATATLTVELNTDMRNGDAVVVDAVGQVDVDGEDFTVTAAPVAAAGDATAPTVLSVLQNRNADLSGHTVDVRFSEQLHDGEGEDVSNYTFTPAGTVTAATIVGAGNVVRVTTSDLILTPGDVTLTVDGDVDDLAGNPVGAPSGPHAMTSTDVDAPSAASVSGNAIEGADDDEIVVSFDDDMIEAEVEDDANWLVESPADTPFDVTGATIDYVPASRTATVTLDAGGQALQQGDAVEVSFLTMRDVAGNEIVIDEVAGTIVAETNRPALHTVWREADPADDQLVLRFSEPCGRLEDLYDAGTNPHGTRFAVRDSGGLLRGYPFSATVLDGGLGVRLSYGFEIAVGSDTLDVIGVTDLAGNVLFPSLDTPVVGDDASAPSQAGAPTVAAVSGENNDTIALTFSTPMSPWRITEHDQYDVRTNPGGTVVDLSGTAIAWDGTSTVTFTLRGPVGESFQAAESYDVTVLADPSDPLRSDRGIAIVADDTVTVATSGDTSDGPSQAGSLAVADTADPNSLLVVFDEAVSETDVEVPASFDYDGGNVATDVELLSPRVVRATFGVPITVGQDVEISQASAVDLAGNDSAGDVTLAVASDGSGPLLSSVAGSIAVGRGGDTVTVAFSEQIDLATGLDPANYTLTNGSAIGLSGAGFQWDSVTASVVIALPSGVELDATTSLSVQVQDVEDVAGNPMPAPVNLGGPITGDATPPGLASAWTHYQLDPAGTTVDVEFDEDVDSAFAGDAANWSTSGAVTVSAVETIAEDHYRLVLSASLGSGETVDLAAGLEDLARNAAGALSADPVDPED